MDPCSMSRIDILCNYSCDANCKFCSVYNLRKKKSISIESIKESILLGVEEGINEVTFSGGEPTLLSTLPELINFAKKWGYKKIQVISHGRKLADNSYVKELKEAGLTHFAISIPDIREEKFNYITRIPNSFEKVIKGLENISKNDLSLETITAIMKTNYEILPKIAEFWQEIEKNYSFFCGELVLVNPIGNAWHNRNEIVASLTNIKPYLHECMKIAKENKTNFEVETIPYCFMQGYYDHVLERNFIEKRIMIRPSEAHLDWHNSRRIQGKTKGEQCKTCLYDATCEGVWNNYVKIFSDKELKPIKKI